MSVLEQGFVGGEDLISRESFVEEPLSDTVAEAAAAVATAAAASNTALAYAITDMNTERSRSVQLRDLPTFGRQNHESAEKFLLKFKRCGVVHN